MYTVGIVATYKDKAGRDPWPLEARSKDYKIRDVMELLQWAEEQGEDRISFTISEVGRLGAVFDKAGDFELMRFSWLSISTPRTLSSFPRRSARSL